MSIEFVLRLIGMVVLAIGGVYLGLGLSAAAGATPDLWAVVFALVGALYLGKQPKDRKAE